MLVDGHCHRRIPARVAVAVAVARGRAEWRDPEARARARAAIEAIVGHVPEREALARAHLIESAVREELIWRPSHFDGAPFAGREHVERALAGGRGVIASFVHPARSRRSAARWSAWPSARMPSRAAGLHLGPDPAEGGAGRAGSRTSTRRASSSSGPPAPIGVAELCERAGSS